MRCVLFLTLWASVAGAQVTFVGSNIGQANSVPVPAGTQAGDLLLVAVTSDNGQFGSYLWPAGFVQLHSWAVDSPDGQSSAVGYRFATGAETTIDVTNRNDNPMVAVAVYRGVDPFFPIESELEDHSIQNGGSFGPWTLTAPAVEVGSANGLVVWLASTDLKLGVNVPGFDGGATTGTTFTPPAGFVLRQQESYIYTSLAIADFRPTGFGPVGPFSGLASVGYVDLGNTVTFIVALRPVMSVQVQASIDFVGESSTRCSGGPDTLFAPPGLQAGDLLIASATFEQPLLTTVVTWPTGFSEFSRVSGGGTTELATAFASKVATGTEGTLAFSVVPTTAGCLFTVLAYRGADPAVGATGSSVGAQGLSPWAFVPPALPSLPAGARIIEAQLLNTPNQNMSKFRQPVGFIERHDQCVDHFGISFSDALAVGGVPTIATASGTDSDNLMGVATTILITLMPPGADGGVDAGTADAGSVDGGGVDAGSVDAGAGTPDAGANDAGGGVDVDAGQPTDGGVGPSSLTVGCGCSSNEALMALGALLVLGRRRVFAR